MSTAWVVVIVAAGAAMILGGAAVGWRVTTRARGKVIAIVEVVPGQPFRLEVPAGPKYRALWLRFQLTMNLPPTRGPKVYIYDHHGIIVTVTIDGRTTQYARGKLVPPEIPAMVGGIAHDERVEGPLERRLYSSTRKICGLDATAALTVTGSIDVASVNTLLTASVWATGPVSAR